MKKFLWILLGCLGIGIIALNMPVSGRVKEQAVKSDKPAAHRVDLSSFSPEPPKQALDLLFLHHSVGGQMLASVGPLVGENCIHPTHPNGGGLRALLEQNNYHVHEASYGSRIGEKTDVFDWLPKFREHMDDILQCDMQDTFFTDGRSNRIVMFKSCFPNSAFVGEGSAPGNPAGPELTVWNAKATYSALLAEFRKRPDVLFVCLTAPPLAPGESAMPLWKRLARSAKRSLRPPPYDLAASAPLARQFNNWLADTNGWLKDYPLNNVVVFDYYDILTDHGASDLSRYATWNGADSHPSSEGNQKAAEALLPFLNQAVHRAGLKTEAPSQPVILVQDQAD